MPTFSVIIPAYNAGDYIKDTLDSVFAQTYKNFEVIIIDDGSTDSTLEILQQVSDSRLKLISQKNSGVSAARNKGIDAAKGKYIAFLDSDDIWKSSHLENALAYFEMNNDVVWYAALYTHEKKSFDAVQFSYKRFATKNFFKGGFLYVHSSTVIVLANEFRKLSIKFREDVCNAEDWIVWHTFANVHPNIGYNFEIETYYRLRSNSLSHSNDNYDKLLPYLHFLKGLLHNKNSTFKQKCYLKFKILERWLVLLSYNKFNDYGRKLKIDCLEELVIFLLFLKLKANIKPLAYLVTVIENLYRYIFIRTSKNEKN